MARPGKLSEEVQDQIVSAIQAGNYSETAANYAGISASTFYSWLDRGRTERDRLLSNDDAEPKEAETPYVDFDDAVEKARASAEVRSVALIQRASGDSWQAAAWYLERSAPQRWGRQMRHEVSGVDGGPVKVHNQTKVEVDVDRAAGILRALDEAGILPVVERPADEPESGGTEETGDEPGAAPSV